VKGESQYAVGDWVVHQAYGIGQIKKVEVKPIHGEQMKCFQVKTKDGAFWFPKDRPDNPRIRPVVTPDIIHQVIKELGEPVVDLDLDRKMWKKRIDEVKASDDLIAASQIVRDLIILRTQRKLNQTEEIALNEWSAAMNMDIGIVRRKLDNYLRACKERASV
jgi:RNA polymerase-interacting CarD/CdnL/TRCF family regulator